jgi:glycosyltransferase involved in cell wall biosynthesis
MMEEKTDQIVLTFVVPCYNVEKYIQRCLDSIFACGLEEDCFEVLCVNDCSPDNTFDILKSNQKCHSNLRIINHKMNKGLGGGRNTGIRESKGRYLWFVDSDDEIVTTGFADALSIALAKELDVLCFNYCRIDEEGKRLSRHVVFGETSVSDGYSFVNKVFGNSIVYHMGYVVRFLYRTDYLRSHQLFFPERVHWEDTVFMPESILMAERIASVPQVFYAYRINSDSITGTFGRVYPAKSIYDYSFFSGPDLLRFSDEVKDDGLRDAFRNTAIQKYINGFAIHLLRTSKRERKRFYELVKEREEEVKPLKQYMNLLNRVMLVPLIGTLTTNMISRVYMMKHGSRK